MCGCRKAKVMSKSTAQAVVAQTQPAPQPEQPTTTEQSAALLDVRTT